MSIAAVAHRHAFGLKADVRGNVHWLDDSTAVYPCGANTVIYHAETKSQKFIPVQDGCDAITAMALAPNKRFIAIAERGEAACIVVYDLLTLRKRKVLAIPPLNAPTTGYGGIANAGASPASASTSAAPSWAVGGGTHAASDGTGGGAHPTLPTSNASAMLAPGVSNESAKEVVSLCFSSDSKYIASLTGGPDWALHNWSWEKGKVMASVRANTISSNSATHVLFNPWDSSQVSVVGNGTFKCYRFVEGTMRQFGGQKVEAKNYLHHCWLTETRILASSPDGHLTLFEGGEPKVDVINTHGPSGLHRDVLVMVPYSRGFVCGCQAGIVTIYEKTDDASYRKAREYSLPEDHAMDLQQMALTPNEETLLVSLRNGQMFALPMSPSDIKPEDIKFDLFGQPFHYGHVTGMDTCVRKPLIVTCSSDRSVRVWNYLDSTSELVKFFPEEAHSIAFHPSGLYILVGFSDKLRLMNLLIDDIRTFREFAIRGCRECRFSHGGQYFAAVHGNVILVYNTWTFECVGTLKGHNGKVRSLTWSPDDARLVSAGMEGAIYEWNVREMRRDGENILKSCSYTCATTSAEGKSIFAVGSDKTLKEICDSQVVREIHSNVVLTQIVLSHSGRMLFTATTTGSIRSIRFPFIVSESGEFQEHQGHAAPVTRLRVSFDDQYLFSAAEDGSVFVWKISDKERSGVPRRDRDLVYADEILVTKSDLEDKTQTMAELRARVEELKMENEYQLRLKDMNFNEKIKETTEKYQEEVEGLKITSAVLKADKEKEEIRHEEEVAEEQQRHARDMEELETTHSTKLMAEYEKYQELQNKTAQLEQQWQQQLEELQSQKQKTLHEFTGQYEAMLKAKQADIDRLQEEMRQQIKEFDETNRETEEDADQEILLIKHKYEKRLREEREVGLRLKGENGIMKKKFNTLNSEIEAHKGEIQRMFQEEKKLQSIIKSLEKDIAGLKKEIQERDETIQDKEKRIYDLKKKNQELEKFKFVLDYKIKELKKQIEPREQDIMNMSEQIKKMDEELSTYNKSNTSLDLLIGDLKLQLRAAEKQVQIEKSKVKYFNLIVKKFKADLNECVQHIQDPKPLKGRVKALYQHYCNLGPPENAEVPVLEATAGAAAAAGNGTRDGAGDEFNVVVGESEAQSEAIRQRQYLERTIAGLRKAVAKDQSRHKADHVKIMQENVALIREINQLRKEIQARTAKHGAAASGAADNDVTAAIALVQGAAAGGGPVVMTATSLPPLPTAGSSAVPDRLPAIH
ncbi:Cilia- and flagella-associated protein 57 [Allomyces javanicus]|nr:Cilia- and flagella-associated protein 57 [Allomyces javanicus]